MRGFVVVAVALAVGFFNLFKPVHIDDALYLAVAQRILSNPLDPYGGELNWQQIPEPTYKSSISPPLLSYYFAVILKLFGDSVVALHASMIPWLLLLAWAMFRLGDRWAGAGLETAVLVLVGPAVVVGTNLMLDVPMLACAASAVELALRAAEKPGSLSLWIGAGAAAAAACLVKYPAVAILPVLALIVIRSRRWAFASALLFPVCALGGWQLWSRSLYGASQVDQSLGFLGQFGEAALQRHLARILSGLAIVGLTCPAWLPAACCGRMRFLSWILASVPTAAAAYLLVGREGWTPTVDAAFCAGVLLGAFALVEALTSAATSLKDKNAKRPRWETVLLVVWIAAFAGVVVLFGPFVAVRSFLPLQPALWMLMLRSCRPSRRRSISVGSAAALAAALSGMLGWADFRWACVYPKAVDELAERLRPMNRPIFFLGHWGFQYYAERAGFLPWDARSTAIPDNGLLIVPMRADKQRLRLSNPDGVSVLETITIPPHPLGWTTWNRRLGVRYYGGDFGEIPWGFSNEPTEQFLILTPTH